jgi:hypothetical protein
LKKGQRRERVCECAGNDNSVFEEFPAHAVALVDVYALTRSRAYPLTPQVTHEGITMSASATGPKAVFTDLRSAVIT